MKSFKKHELNVLLFCLLIIINHKLPCFSATTNVWSSPSVVAIMVSTVGVV